MSLHCKLVLYVVMLATEHGGTLGCYCVSGLVSCVRSIGD